MSAQGFTPLKRQVASMKCVMQALLSFALEGKRREVISYLFFGALSFLVSVLSYALFALLLNVDVLLSNAAAWVLSVSFAFATNRTFVFTSSHKLEGEADGTLPPRTSQLNGESNAETHLASEIAKFFSGRLFTLAVEEAILFVFIKRLGLGVIAVKLAATAIVVILNYFLSKFWVFAPHAA